MAGCGRYAALVRRGHRRHGGRLTTVRRASRLSGSSGASARGAGSHGPVVAALDFLLLVVLAPRLPRGERADCMAHPLPTASDRGRTPLPALLPCLASGTPCF